MTPEPGGGTLGSPLNTPPPGPGPWYRLRLHIAGQQVAEDWVSTADRDDATAAMARVLAAHAILVARAAAILGAAPLWLAEVYDPQARPAACHLFGPALLGPGTLGPGSWN